MDNEDEDCAKNCLGGDHFAMKSFVERFHGPLFGFCFRRLRNREDAEDVAQQTLVRALRHLHHWDTSRPFKPWIFKIALNRCQSHLGQRNRQIRIENIRFEFENLEDCPGNLELSEELELALKRIREEYRTCFCLYHFKELSVTRIAEIMECPEGTVKTWLHRARFELAESLMKRGVVSKDGYELQ